MCRLIPGLTRELLWAGMLFGYSAQRGRQKAVRNTKHVLSAVNNVTMFIIGPTARTHVSTLMLLFAVKWSSVWGIPFRSTVLRFIQTGQLRSFAQAALLKSLQGNRADPRRAASLARDRLAWKTPVTQIEAGSSRP